MWRMWLTGLLILLLFASTASAQSEHTHTWGEWVPLGDGRHMAQCTAGDDATSTQRHYNMTVTAGGATVRVCAICGAGQGIMQPFPVISQAQAIPRSVSPAAQRGMFLVRGMKNPFSADQRILFAFSLTYEHDGGIATFKNLSDIHVPLPIALPKGWKLFRIASAAGDDSVQNPETWVELEAAHDDDILTFVTKTPALYVITTGD